MATTKVTPVTTLASAVANGGTFTVAYPTGYQRSDFVGGTRRIVAIAASEADGAAAWAYFTSPEDFGVALGASSITVTNRRAATIPAGYVAKIELDLPFGDAEHDPVRLPSDRVRLLGRGIAYLDLGNPVVSSATALKAAAAIGGAGALALLAAGQTFDVPRNVIITSVGDDSGDTFAVVGTDEYGAVVHETITGANAGVAAGVKAFKTITSITASGASAGNVSIGYGDVLGLPIWVSSSVHILKEVQDDAAPSAGTFVGGLARETVSTATTADVRGTYDPNAAADGSRSFGLLVFVDDPTFKGNPQYDG